MRSVVGRAIVVGYLCCSNLSCGGDAPAKSLYPVHGKVSYKGEPAAGAVISLQSEGEAPMTLQGNPIVPMGVAGEDGTFTIACTGLGDGAPAGQYKVLIVWRPAGNSPATKQLLARRKRSPDYDPKALIPGDPFDGRYSNPGKPVFKANVKEESNELTFELKD